MDWLGTLKTLAPTVATALGGPLAGMAVSALGGILGQASPTAATIASSITDGQLTPDHLAQIRQLELQYQNDEKERQFKYSDLAFKDVASARGMEAATKSTTPTVLTYLIVLSGIALMTAVIAGWVKADNVMSGTIIGYAVSEMKVVLQFWFGGTKASDADPAPVGSGN